MRRKSIEETPLKLNVPFLVPRDIVPLGYDGLQELIASFHRVIGGAFAQWVVDRKAMMEAGRRKTRGER